ncbi:antibiotic biosynthesis monooxygenase family protein [Neobacillus dielmonensis]|uniref:antibiotic biosynthesis monooxygenase family protein n=1 Tax=Neobacillus dielmonensis TaxID=1347369 RepID=UPI0005A8E3CC|nr:antibiotic biosynthesis monooxygenase [Neobacillus dielmonensis]
MFCQIKRFVVKEGYSQQIVERFSNRGGLVEQQPGFIDRDILVKKVRRGDEEVLVMMRWESEEDWKNWEKSPEHIAGHRAKQGNAKPEYVIESSQDVYLGV